MGRRSTFDPNIHPALAKAFYERGLSDQEVAAELGISFMTIYSWCKKWPKFDLARKQGKEHPNALVVNALFKKALGFEYEEVTKEPVRTETLQGKRGPGRPRKTEYEVTKIIKKQAAPDTNAIELWVLNKLKKDWKSKQTVEIEGGLNINMAAVEMTPEERIAWLAQHGYSKKEETK